MKVLIIIALGLLLGAAVISAANYDAGFVLLQYGGWSLETSLMVFVVLLIILMLLLYVTLHSLRLLKRFPGKLSSWQQRQKQHRAGQALTRGLITFEEGRWAEAEHILIRYAEHSETPLLHYLAAARAAQKQHAEQRRDNYLRLAHEATQGADIAVGVVQAELQLDAGQKERALATLQHLREMAPKHPYVLQLLQKLYRDMQQWQDMQKVLPDLRKRHVLDDSEVKALDSDAIIGQLQHALSRQDWQAFAQIWQQTPTRLKQSEDLLKPYVEGLLQQGESQQAIVVIEQFMRSGKSNELIYQYGLIGGGDMFKRLAVAEKWLQNWRKNPWLLLTLGRLAAEAELWVKAEEYLQASLQYGARGETYRLLAKVQRAGGRLEIAAETTATGLDFMLQSQQ